MEINEIKKLKTSKVGRGSAAEKEPHYFFGGTSSTSAAKEEAPAAE